MTHRTRRALWWTLTTLLTLATITTATFGAWQFVQARLPVPSPADAAQARAAVLDTAKSSAAALLSYTPDNAEKTLTDAAKLTTGAFHDSFVQLTRDVVIPGAKEKDITAAATIPAAAVDSLGAQDASVIVFINQTVTVSSAAPTTTASSVRMQLHKVNGAWLIATFEPI